MATLKNNHDPQFVLLPVNNDRTGWKPFGLPVLLVVPHRVDPAGAEVPNSGVWGVRIYIEDVPQEARVAGHDHIGLRFPDRELYGTTLSGSELQDRLLPPEALTYVRNGQSIARADAREGDHIRLTAASGVTDIIPYVPSADYYDLSDVLLDLETLPTDRYALVYEAQFFTRQRAQRGEGELLCIDVNSIAFALLRMYIQHPGDVLDEFYRLTPPIYLTDSSKGQDSTVALYRPLTDALQDVMDEQALLERINWVYEAPYEAIPYISSLLGWDLPFFPESLDQLRRVILRNTARLQELKGSRAAVVELFKLLGLEILISNLWWAPDGLSFVRPRLGGGNEESIGIRPVYQLEPLLAGYDRSGFSELTIPLLHRPQEVGGLDDFAALQDGGNLVVDAYLVEANGPADIRLQQLIHGGGDTPIGMMADPDGFGVRYGGIAGRDPRGNEINPVTARLTGLGGIGGYAQIELGGKLGSPTAERYFKTWGRPPVTAAGLGLDRERNELRLTLNGYLRFDGDSDLPPKRIRQRVYAFIGYTRQELIVPPAMRSLQSNRFDIQLLIADPTPALAGQKNYVSPGIFEFAFEFLNKVKAFHSLLNVLRYTIELTETYEVTGICVGGDILQRHDTEIGRLQVPPAKLPLPPEAGNQCAQQDAEALGYSFADITLRLRKLANLPEEHAAWQALDSRDTPAVQATTGQRLRPAQPAPGRDSCKFTDRGQDRTTKRRVDTAGVEESPTPSAGTGTDGGRRLAPADPAENDTRPPGEPTSTRSNSALYSSFLFEGSTTTEPLCETDGITDYCYPGRAEDRLLYRLELNPAETVRPHAGKLSLGHGVYWTRAAGDQLFLEDRQQRAGLLQAHTTPPAPRFDNHLGRLYRAHGAPIDRTLHYDARTGITAPTPGRHLALTRPGLDIRQSTLHFPGCRFPTLQGNPVDVEITEWRARPWDDRFSSPCWAADGCDGEPDRLGAELIDDGFGGTKLQFRDEPCMVRANGFRADIPSLGEHTLSEDWEFGPTAVIHKVYSQTPSGHASISLDAQAVAGAASDGTIPIAAEDARFDTWRTCRAPVEGGQIEELDYADGYSAETGATLVPTEEEERYGFSFSLVPETALFLLGDGILVGDGVRLGDDEVVVCGFTLGAALAPFGVREGERDWDYDQISVDPRAVLDEYPGAGSLRLDGSIRSLFELESTGLPHALPLLS